MTDPPIEYWERILKAHPAYETMEQLRNAIDLPGWKERDRARELAKEASKEPPRKVSPTLGQVESRHYRQVNVKLATTDFESLTALAITRDVAPTTLARMLLRNAVRDLADGKREL